MRTVSSRKSGFPPAFAQEQRPRDAGRRPRSRPSSSCHEPPRSSRSASVPARGCAGCRRRDEGRARVGQLGAGGRRGRGSAHAVGVLGSRRSGQLEQRRLGPVEVLEDEHERALGGQKLEEAPDTPVQLGLRDLAAAVRASRSRRRLPTRFARPRRSSAARPGRPCRDSRRRPSFAETAAALVVVDDAGGVLDNLDHGPVRDALAVGQAAAPVDGWRRRGVGRRTRRSGGSCRSRGRRRPGRALDDVRRDLRPRAPRATRARLPADERRGRCRAAPPAQLARSRATSQTGTGSALPFAAIGSAGPVVDRVRRRPVGLLADDDPVDGRRATAAAPPCSSRRRLPSPRPRSGEHRARTSASPVLTPVRMWRSSHDVGLVQLGDSPRGSRARRERHVRGRPRARPGRRRARLPRRR